MKILIDIPSEVHLQIINLAAKEGRRTKPYIERLVLSHVERKIKSNLKSKSITK